MPPTKMQWKPSRENGKNNTTAINELVDENVTNVTE